jgi:hypothetical protein
MVWRSIEQVRLKNSFVKINQTKYEYYLSWKSRNSLIHFNEVLITIVLSYGFCTKYAVWKSF